MTEVYIVSACRTGIGAFNGQYSTIPTIKLGTTVIEEALTRSGLNPSDLDEVVMGQVLMGGHGQNPARQACLNAKLPLDVTARTVNMVCGSGLRAVYDGYNAIKCGESNVVLAGGMENMSQARHCTFLRNGVKLGTSPLEDMILADGLVDPLIKLHMGNTIEHLANKYNVSREEQDDFALISQQRAAEAIGNGYFKNEIVAVVDSKLGSIEKDEHVRLDTSKESLTKLRPAFEKTGSVTAGNASGINDGAAALVLCNSDVVKSKNLTALAKIVGFAQAGCEPIEMGIGPVPAVKKLMTRVGWSINDVDLFELNEAFAAQAIIVNQQLGLDPSKVNVAGGAIALGHPIGCSGARVLVTLIYNMKRLNKSKGVAALCIGGGMGIAIAIESC
ncbi:acetyl-CoA acetyltransferase, cytosolic [Onthophagus taurus]|uniref:acetyl-CoA acetyltransferase, cytosolic n=1 Tax=Onthophagus taurus TaxID=166361 RepID=UPI000C20F6A9|nr:acetyl-CoA acetyltransferase, cytosolic [Onthophagus taurus]